MQKPTERTRQRIVEAADELFYRQGITATSVDAVVAHAGLSKPTFYRYFPSKESLVEAYLHERDSRNRVALEAILDEHIGRPVDRLLAVFDWLDQWHHKPSFRGCAFARTAAEFDNNSPLVARAIRTRNRWLRSRLHQLAVEAAIPVPVQFGDAMLLLVEGATTTAFVEADLQAARKAKRVAWALVTLFNEANE